ncbi:protein FAM167A-like [Liolophura sinensis]|uniref:protein FAM167A-like n=1 Tax=Liolophura sinensis TaxID=3198878 RepID=UPI003158AE04
MRDANSNRLELPSITVDDFSTEKKDEEHEVLTFVPGRTCLCPTSGDSHFDQLIETTTRLNLKTRRPSYTAWREQYLGKPLLSSGRPFTIHETETDNDDFTEDRKTKIEESLEWLRHELMDMRSQDKLLACRLLSLRKDIHQFKLQKGQQEHEELLDDVQADYEEFNQLSELCDMPMDELVYNNNPLKHLGVTRLNLNARRFSTC